MMNQRAVKKGFVAVLLMSCCALTFAQTKPAGSMASVNGVAIPEALLTQNVNANLAQGQKDSPELRQVIKDELINREVLAQESARLGLDKTPVIAGDFITLPTSVGATGATGEAGAQGIQGQKGDIGAPLEFELLTDQQKLELRGDVGNTSTNFVNMFYDSLMS